MNRVLVIEDDLTSRRQIDAALRRGAFEPLLAQGPAAVAALDGERPPMLVVLGWETPGAGGLEMLRWLRGRVGGSATWVLVLAGRANREDEIAALDAGADDYLLKPVDAARLRAHLRVGARRAAEAASRAAGGDSRGREAA